METKYDIIVDFFLDNWFFAVLILISVFVMAIPQLKDGVISLYKMAKSILCVHKTEEMFEIKYEEETVTLHRWLVSKQFDVVRRGLEMILDDKLEQKKRAEKRKQTLASISAIKAKLGKE